jgi:Zn-dependent peptidase ImmA (M78 family)/DNA-binding XRE family transcriptional regulator
LKIKREIEMRKSFEVFVNPDIIRWARESSGYSIEEIAKKLKISVENYIKIERGEKKPTFKQIEKLSHYFKRPISAFLLSEAPKEKSIAASFRILPKSEKGISKGLILAIRKARYYQSIVKELITDLNLDTGAQVLSASIYDDPIKLARIEREKLGISIERQFNFKNAYEAFNTWRDAVEKKNIFVFQFNFPIESARGFSLMDEEPPVIVLNLADNILARIFTLFHEYAHILLRIPEIYSGEEVEERYPEEENWCNNFASEFLVPEFVLKEEPAFIEFKNGVKSLEEVVVNLSKRFMVSKHAILTKFMLRRWITKEEYDEEVQKLKLREEKKKTIPVQLHKKCIQEKGKKFVSIIMESREKGLITTADAIEYLSLKLDSLEKLEKLEQI